MIRKTIFLIFIGLSLLTLQAKSRKKTIENLPLHHTKWVLIEVFDSYVDHSPDTAFIIFYDNYKFYGNLGCNIFFGEYSFSKKRIKLDYSGSTKKLCADMYVEEKFFKAIKNDITHYYIEKNTLYLLNKLKVICIFEGTSTNE